MIPFLFQDFRSFSLSLFGILCLVDSLSLPLLFGLVGIYPLPAGYSSVSSSCLYCCVWGVLSVFWQFVVPLYCGGSSLWVGLDEWLVKVSWAREACVSVLVGGAGFLLSGVQ